MRPALDDISALILSRPGAVDVAGSYVVSVNCGFEGIA